MAMAALQSTSQFERLMAVAAGGETGRHLAHLIAYLVDAPLQGKGCLPLNLGLGDEYTLLLAHYFPTASQWLMDDLDPLFETRSAMREELMGLREDEWQELVDLLELYRKPGIDSRLSKIVATGCLGGDHLWRDLGLPDRQALSELMKAAWPELEARNTQDMKWKRFFYKQLCEREGGYVCRAPSCEQCSAYSDCFGPEV